MISEVHAKIKDNPIKTTLVSITSIIGIITALFTVDARYAHADDVERDRADLVTSIQDSTKSLRRQTLEDRIFEIDLAKSYDKNRQLTPYNQALRDRYQQELNDLK